MSVMYVLREGVSGFRRAKLSALGSIITVTLALLLLGLFYIVSTNTSRLLSSVREKVEMEVFLAEPIGRQRISEINQQILDFQGVEHVEFVTKDEAARIFKEEFGEDVNSVLDFNPLPPSFRIQLKDEYRTSAYTGELSAQLQAITGVRDVVYHQKMLEFVETQTDIIFLVGMAIGSLIGLSAIFLVSNTIRLTIYAKRKSVQTMKLVGASRWMVRAPFIVEGMLQGGIGGLLAAGILYYTLRYATRLVSDTLAQFIVVGPEFYFLVVAVGIALGLFGSAISVKKFIGETVAG